MSANIAKHLSGVGFGGNSLGWELDAGKSGLILPVRDKHTSLLKVVQRPLLLKSRSAPLRMYSHLVLTALKLMVKFK